ncbi:MAG: GH3 auxin-responsive promoter family protein [Chitinophagaceae bacterium]|nr:GH3 auxin-responsive promoter family protein [Chitinophagaceae bacterium]
MPLLGPLIDRTIAINDRLREQRERLLPVSASKHQERQLKRLLRKAAYTAFGRHYRFYNILMEDDVIRAYRESIPIFNYNSIQEQWWNKALNGEANICWPGSTKYFALSSGTSESSSKRIPITGDMIRAIKRASVKQILSARHFGFPPEIFEKRVLMLGGSTDLNKRGKYFEGDLSGISAKKIPYWFQVFYKPGRKIAQEKDWDKKLNEIAEKAGSWDISIIVGVPAWIQIMLERIIEWYDLENIHELWPNLICYVHSGVSFEPYRSGFKKLFGKKVIDINTYLASEGFIAFTDRPDTEGMKMLLTNGIFYEFIPFNEENFDEHGELKQGAKALYIGEVSEGIPYALLLSTCAGAWRYLIGDVVQFTSVARSEIIITGRTKHYLSLTGEHLSVDNMNHAIEMVNDELSINIREFSVAGIPYQGLFAHQWYIGCDDPVDQELLRKKLDEHLIKLNDDYAIERKSALKEILVTVLPTTVFMDWMRKQGKLGGQHKFPRVLKKKQLEDWLQFLSESTDFQSIEAK